MSEERAGIVIEEGLPQLRGRVWVYLRALGADPATADDLAQEAILIAIRAKGEFANEQAAGKFLRTTASNLWMTHIATASRRKRILTDGVTPHLQRQATERADMIWERLSNEHGEDYLQALERCLSGLSDRAREALRLHYSEQLSGAEIGRQLAMREDAVHALLSRARRSLRTCIQGKLNP